MVPFLFNQSVFQCCRVSENWRVITTLRAKVSYETVVNATDKRDSKSGINSVRKYSLHTFKHINKLKFKYLLA